jgi:hypothetical protein
MADTAVVQEPEFEPGVDAPPEKLRRDRPRLSSLKFDKQEIANRISRFYETDNQNRSDEIDARLQRYAKFRMWTEGKSWPWEDASDAAIPDMMTASMRMQDTLHNAVMSQRPPVMAKALKKTDSEKTNVVDDLLDYQFFEEQNGEEIVGELADDFVNEGFYTAYIPWVKETRGVVDIRVMDAIPEGVSPADYFRSAFLQGEYPQASLTPSKDGWDWTVDVQNEKKKHRVSFFTRPDGEVEVEIEKEAIRYDGPRVIRKDLQDVLHPVRCSNLQIPGPSNPTGASHVIIKDTPSVDELKRLQMSGYYDLMSQEDVDKIGSAVRSRQYEQREQQKDVMQGAMDWKDYAKEAESHKPLTRLMVFDCYDIDGDGLDEDVIFWIILETKTLLRARYLTQMFPAPTPMRPFAEGHLFPVPGRRFSIGVLEMMEGVHDLIKQFFDMSADGGTIANAPFGFYKATSNMRPEVIRLWPGELYPLNDPKNDVVFPNLGNTSQSFGFNMLALLNQMEEKLTNIGDLQLGRVPQGKSSALRTVTGMQTVLAQGDARPERVLRRFFMGLAQIWKVMHTLNQAFLPREKQYLISGFKEPVKDPYAKIDDKSKITGSFLFKFSANALNTSKEAMQGAIDNLMGTYVSQLNLQLGIIDADGIYRMQRDKGRAFGIDPDKYIKPPSPGADVPKIFFEEALTMILSGQTPIAQPVEGAEAQFQKLTDFMNSDEFGHLGPDHLPIFKGYYERIAKQMVEERQKQQMLAAVEQFQQAHQQPGQGGPQAGPQAPQSPTPVQGNELLDESCYQGLVVALIRHRFTDGLRPIRSRQGRWRAPARSRPGANATGSTSCWRCPGDGSADAKRALGPLPRLSAGDPRDVGQSENRGG